ncbi:hypothetical protein BOX17_01040 [Halomonas aestuarii]|uniref:Uncharacterized protein n=1 Tax=Halomonas aestuarii TaxID=1897729 RepID=A0A1J0VC88_9GAMM|nr:hypothetical protein [Halomonas aestuarii]APE29664.1 hypothetical protein BOX17_01040 [Halomonas aestuarii]
MFHLSLFAVLALAVPLVHADDEGVVFTMGAERFVLTPVCAQRVGHALAENDLMHLRFDMPETPQCFGAFQGLLSSHLGERLAVTFRGETLLEADLHTRLGPRNIVLVSRHRRIAFDAARFLGGWPRPDAP